MSTEKGRLLKGVLLKKPRPKSKAERLSIRKRYIMQFNHPDLLEERRQRAAKFYPDEVETTRKRREKRKTADEEADELFKDLEGQSTRTMPKGDEESMPESKAENKSDFPSDDSESEELERSLTPDIIHGDKESMPEPKAETNLDFPSDDSELEESERSLSPDVIYGNSVLADLGDESGGFIRRQSSITSDQGQGNDQNKQRQAKKKLSKKKRDSQKRRVQKLQNGVYEVEMGAAKFQVVTLDDAHDIEADDQDEGVLMRRPTLYSSSSNNNKSLISFRDQLIQMSTASKRSGKQCWKRKPGGGCTSR